MRILYLTLNRHAAELIRSFLGNANISMSIASSFTQVELLQYQDYKVIIVDEIVSGIKGVNLVSQLRLLEWPKKCEFWYSAFDKSESHPDVQKAMTEMNAKRFFRSPISALDLKTALFSLNAQSRASIALGSLRMVAQIWASKSTVMLQSDSAKAFFSMGALVHQDPDDGLMKILQDMSPKIVHTNIPSGGDWLETGNKFLGLKLSPPRSWLVENQYLGLMFSSFSSTIVQLNLSKNILQFLESKAVTKIITWSEEHQAECYKLWGMGFLSFCEPSIQEPQKVVRRRSAPSLQNPVVLLQQLQAEWKRIETAEPWAVLGLTQTASGALIRETVQRLEFRYTEFIEKPRQREDIVAIATKLRDHVRKSAQGWQQTSEEGRMPEHIRLFTIAKKMFEQKEYHKAEHMLKRATRLVIDDANIHAWMGWAIMHNPEHNADSKTSDALDCLLYAISIDEKNTDALFFLTQFYRERNQPEQALNPARLLNRLKPSKDSKILIEAINEEIKNQSS